MKAYLNRHLQVLFATLGNMLRTPVASVSTVTIIAIGLLLPLLLYITIQSGGQLSKSWQGQPQFSVFLQPDLQPAEAQLIFDELRLHPAIQLAEFVSPDAALEEFKALSGLEVELSFLDDNPLPASIVVLPAESHYQATELDQLRGELSGIDGIEDIRMDLDWIDRFNAMLRYISRAAQVLSAVLAIALVLIVGITIKLLIVNRRQEIEITKLVGGSNQFVRRPFLYFGALYGLFGALLSLILLMLIGQLMSAPMAELATLYQHDSLLYKLGWQEFGTVVLAGTLLGWLAARLSVAQHLGDVRPK